MQPTVRWDDDKREHWVGGKCDPRSGKGGDIDADDRPAFTLAKPRTLRAFSVGPAPGVGRDKMTATRRLAAVLAADVAGYLRLMGEDKEGTLAALRAVRRELSDPKDRKSVV